MTTTRSVGDTFVSATHPAFCEGGIACEAQRRLPTDWSHRGYETAFFILDKRVTLRLMRYDGQSRGEGYCRGDVRVELSFTDTELYDRDGNKSPPARNWERVTSTGCSASSRSTGTSSATTPRTRPQRAGADSPTDELPKRTA